jgi:hypothetical protein
MVQSNDVPLTSGVATVALDHPNLTYGQLVGPPSVHEGQAQGDKDLSGAAAAAPNSSPLANGQISGGGAGVGVNATGSSQQQSVNGRGAHSAGGPAGSVPTAGLQLPPSASPQQPIVFTVTDPVRRDVGGLFGLKSESAERGDLG